MTSIRKNIKCLSTNELHDLREALSEMYTLAATDFYGFEMIAGLHGSPSPFYCEHGYPGFLTWHRAYMLLFEEALQRINCDIALPFWNWSSGPSTGLPSAVSNATYTNRDGAVVDNPLHSGPIPTSLVPSGMTSRSSTVDTRVFDSYATAVQTASGNSDFDDFQIALNGPHGSVHGAVGGQMSGVSTAGFDPLFYLHHANIDRVWANWQKTHTAALPLNEASLELEPFTHPIGGALKTGVEMFSTEALGYRYSNFCIYRIRWPFDVIFELRELLKLSTIRTAKLVFKADAMPKTTANLHLFIGDKDATLSDASEKNPSFAGSVGFFGGPMQMLPKKQRRRFDLSIDITNALRSRLSVGGSLPLKIVVVDPEEKEVKLESLRVSDLELHIEE